MGRYEKRLQRDLDTIGGLVSRIGAAVEHALAEAVRCVLQVDIDGAADVVLGDNTVNALIRDLDERCHAFVARHLPSAGHLRFVSSVLRLSIALERIGDYATTIARTAVQLGSAPPETVERDLEMMTEHARRVLHESLRSFAERNAALARTTEQAAVRAMPVTDKVIGDLESVGEQRVRPMHEVFAFMATMNRLERVVHQAKNICEETVFVATGEAKKARAFQVLFLDERNDGASLLAECLARKGYAQFGMFRSAGWQPARHVDASFASYAEAQGVDLHEVWPKPLATVRESLHEFQVVVDLDGRGREHLGRVPFHTTLVRWDIAVDGSPEQVHRALLPRIGDLVDRLRGVDASV